MEKAKTNSAKTQCNSLNSIEYGTLKVNWKKYADVKSRSWGEQS